MLCDEPGLGKTITVLALLLRTRGLMPGKVRRWCRYLPVSATANACCGLSEAISCCEGKPPGC